MNKIPRSRIAEVIAKRSLKPVPARKLAREIAAYLLVEHRSADLESLLRDILQYRADQGIVEVRATSAHSLNARLRSDIKAQIRELYPSAKQVIIDEELDETVLGSIRLELANQQFDASLRTKLNRFKQLTAAGKD
jgi:F0F1-type ATP synthase delta subunit